MPGMRRVADRSRTSVALRPAVGSPAKRKSKRTDVTGAIPVAAGLDLAARLRASERSVRSRLEGRDALLMIVRAANGALEPQKIADLIIEAAATWLPLPCWAVVASTASSELLVLAERGLGPDMGSAARAVAAWVMQRCDEFSTADLASDPRIKSSVSGAVVAFALTSRGRRVGALVALDRLVAPREPRLQLGLLRAVRVLLEPPAVALDNALKLKRVEELSVTDDLTQLYNSRYLDLVLRRETKRASRSGRPLSLLFIDLDGFKAVNDTHGHLSGSRALVEAGGVIRGSARETDIVARFGGDEFAIILPDTGSEGAFAVGERVRDRLAAHHFLGADGLNIHLTASVGVATLPDVAASAEELVHAADKAMYQVKDSGKNGIQAAASPADN